MGLTYPPMRRLAIGILAAVALAGCGGEDSEPDPGRFDSERAFADLEAQVELGPRPAGSAANRENAALIAERLRDAGVEDVVIQRPWRNVVGTIPGSDRDGILLAAHHDTKDVPGMLGANDGASGVAVVLEIARALPDRVAGPSVHIALFDAEEARGERDFERRRDARQPPVRPLRPRGGAARRRGPGHAAAAGDRLDDPPRPRGRLRPADPAGGELRPRPLRADRRRGRRGGLALRRHRAAGVRRPHPVRRGRDPRRRPDRLHLRARPEPGRVVAHTEDTIDKVCPESLDAVGEAVVAVLP